MNRYGKSIIVGLAMLSMAVLLAACGSSGTASTSSAASGVVKVDVTDAPSLDYAHVYITVTGIGFHTSSTTGFTDYSSGRRAGWQTVTLAAPQTIDLAQLANGTMYADLSGSSLFDGITLPTGRYQQLRIFLASTEASLTDSASALGLTYNNEVQFNGDTTHYPLRVPSADSSGIKVVPESPVVVTDGSTVSLALDFNLGDDVVEVSPNGTVEFMLKPRLGYFDMGSVGAVTGAVSFSNLSTSRIEVKAEQVKNGDRFRSVRRSAAVDRTTGAFNLYPLPIFGNATTATYDIVIRGRQVETAIIKGVTVHKGTTPATGVDLGIIPLQAATDFTTQLGSGMHPTGSWMNFYQTVGGDTFMIRDRHLDPYTGKFHSGVELSSGSVEVATYVPGGTLAFATYSSSRGQFSMVANAAGDYTSGTATTVDGRGRMSVSVSGNPPQSTNGSSSITGTFDTALLGTGTGHGMGGGMGGRGGAQPTSGQLFVVQDGMIIDSTGTMSGDGSVVAAMTSTGGSVSLGNLPSGTYSMYALGWGGGTLEAGSARGINLSGGNGRATINMR